MSVIGHGGPPAQSVLLIPTLAINPVVEAFRMQYDPSARAGIPAHVTVMYPFLDPAKLTPEAYSLLDRLLGATAAFDYRLTAVQEFEQGVLYLAPEPAVLFVTLIEAVSRGFGLVPFGGAFPSIIPHLTVSQSAPATERERIAAAIRSQLPMAATASEAWVMVGHNSASWRTVHITRFS